MNLIKKYNSIIFDLDGTLLDTLDDLANCVNYILRKHEFPEISVDDTRRFVGNGIAKLMESAIPKGSSNPLFETCLEVFGSYYSANMDTLTRPYPGILELLGELKKRKYNIAIVSNKFDKAVKALANKYFAEYIQVATGESESVARKPAPGMVFKALEELGTDSKSALYVGDSDIDILTAKNAAIPCICVSWGFRDREFLAAHGAECIIDRPMELLDLLEEK